MTTNAKLLIFTLNLWLLFSTPLMAEEDALETSTETVTEQQPQTTTTIQTAEAENPFTTCDFDLENIESLLPYMQDICTEIYYNRTENDSLYNLYLAESQSFAKFYKKLNDYELRNQLASDKEEMKKYPFEGELRYEIYNKVDVSQCSNSSNISAVDYLNCLKVKHIELADLVPNVEEK